MQRVFYSPVPSLDIAVLNEPPTRLSVTVREILNQQILDWDWLLITKGHVKKRVSEMNERPAKCVFTQNAQAILTVCAFFINSFLHGLLGMKHKKYSLTAR